LFIFVDIVYDESIIFTIQLTLNLEMKIHYYTDKLDKPDIDCNILETRIYIIQIST